MNNEIWELSIEELDAVTGGAALRSGAEISILNLNSLVAKPSTELSTITSMMSSMESGANSVASHLRG